MPVGDRLSALDASFLSLEREALPMHVGGLLVFDGPAPTFADLRAELDWRLDAVPRYRQRIAEVPLGLALPCWVDDEHFDIDYHLRHVALPAPGNDDQLATMSARVLANRLDLNRPLWEMWFIEGLADGRWALLSKVHHSMIDGISGRDIMEIILEELPEAAPREASRWTPRPEPSEEELVALAARDTLTDPVSTVEGIVTAMRSPQKFAKQAAARVVGTIKAGQRLAHTEDFLVGAVGPHRRWQWVEIDLDQVKKTKRELGVTVNDVLLAGISNGLRELLLGQDFEVRADSCVRTMVPVSVRREGDKLGGNQVAAVFVDLPVGISDPAEVVSFIHQEMAKAKVSGEILSVPTLVDAAPFVPPALLAAGGRVASRINQRSVGTVTTNVPGPQHSLYFMGRQLRATVPFVPLGPGLRVGFAMMSYNGSVYCGITADAEAIPSLEPIRQGIESALANLDTM